MTTRNPRNPYMPPYLQISAKEECCIRAKQQCHCQTKDHCIDPRRRNCRQCCRRCNRNPPTCLSNGQSCTLPACPGKTCGNAPEGTCLDERNCDKVCTSMGYINWPPKGYFEEVTVCKSVQANSVMGDFGKFTTIKVGAPSHRRHSHHSSHSSTSDSSRSNSSEDSESSSKSVYTTTFSSEDDDASEVGSSVDEER